MSHDFSATDNCGNMKLPLGWVLAALHSEHWSALRSRELDRAKSRLNVAVQWDAWKVMIEYFCFQYVDLRNNAPCDSWACLLRLPIIWSPFQTQHSLPSGGQLSLKGILQRVSHRIAQLLSCGSRRAMWRCLQLGSAVFPEFSDITNISWFCLVEMSCKHIARLVRNSTERSSVVTQ